MPLFNYMCLKCNEIVEKFQHKPEEIDIECEECGHDEFERVIGNVHHKIVYDANGTLKNRIKPDMDRIYKNISKGKDNDFLDIAGE